MLGIISQPTWSVQYSDKLARGAPTNFSEMPHFHGGVHQCRGVGCCWPTVGGICNLLGDSSDRVFRTVNSTMPHVNHQGTYTKAYNLDRGTPIARLSLHKYYITDASVQPHEDCNRSVF